MLTGPVTSLQLATAQTQCLGRRVHWQPSPVEAEALWAAWPHLETSPGQGGVQVAIAEATCLPFHRAAARLRTLRLLTPLLAALRALPWTHAVLTADLGPSLHQAHHEDLLAEVAESHGIERALLSPEAYQQALLALDLPVLTDGMYEAVALSSEWPQTAPPGCPDWLWADLLQVRQGLAGFPASPDVHSMFYPAVLVTAHDRLAELHSELLGYGEVTLTHHETRQLVRQSRRAQAVWTQLTALEQRCAWTS
ncbi:hypothetical protein [Deinococcus multiflagellatus]|uniref:Uncharacterized protein n=1 Tax=Deinococcus multiflagellatus TaxID=1656887 RepID=A0ABW1ZVC0_9DEIO|nr:hypothetical protein [Deinococcus multiflagellatus]MBZ9714480.1 hypothetical protein [Deinococcus multiflagellatus]